MNVFGPEFFGAPAIGSVARLTTDARVREILRATDKGDGTASLPACCVGFLHRRIGALLKAGSKDECTRWANALCSLGATVAVRSASGSADAAADAGTSQRNQSLKSRQPQVLSPLRPTTNPASPLLTSLRRCGRAATLRSPLRPNILRFCARCRFTRPPGMPRFGSSSRRPLRRSPLCFPLQRMANLTRPSASRWPRSLSQAASRNRFAWEVTWRSSPTAASRCCYLHRKDSFFFFSPFFPLKLLPHNISDSLVQKRGTVLEYVHRLSTRADIVFDADIAKVYSIEFIRYLVRGD